MQHRYRVRVDGGELDLRRHLEANLSLKFDLRKNGPWPDGDFVVGTDKTSDEVKRDITMAMSQAAKELGFPAGRPMPMYSISELPE
jgi:hypothetical protein